MTRDLSSVAGNSGNMLAGVRAGNSLAGGVSPVPLDSQGVHRFFFGGMPLDGSAEPPFSSNARDFGRRVPLFRNISKYGK